MKSIFGGITLNVLPNDAESLVHAFISLHLEYCDALFTELAAHSISRYNTFNILRQEY